MKKIVLFFLMMLPVAVIADDFKWFDEPFQTLHEKSFKVIQALDDHYALVLSYHKYIMSLLIYNRYGHNLRP